MIYALYVSGNICFVAPCMVAYVFATPYPQIRKWSPKHRNFRKYPIVMSPVTNSDPYPKVDDSLVCTDHWTKYIPRRLTANQKVKPKMVGMEAFLDVTFRPLRGYTANIVSYCCENLKQQPKQPSFYFHTGYGKEQVLYTVSDNVCYLLTTLNCRKYASNW